MPFLQKSEAKPIPQCLISTLNDGNKVTIETHLFGFEGNAYGEALTLSFVHRLRDEQRFDSLEALRHQLQQDADNTLHILNDYANQ